MYRIERSLVSRRVSGVVDGMDQLLGDIISISLQQILDIHTHGLYHCLHVTFLLTIFLCRLLSIALDLNPIISAKFWKASLMNLGSLI